MPIYRIVVNEANYFNNGMVVNEAKVLRAHLWPFLFIQDKGYQTATSKSRRNKGYKKVTLKYLCWCRITQHLTPLNIIFDIIIKTPSCYLLINLIFLIVGAGAFPQDEVHRIVEDHKKKCHALEHRYSSKCQTQSVSNKLLFVFEK